MNALRSSFALLAESKHVLIAALAMGTANSIAVNVIETKLKRQGEENGNERY